MGDRKQPRPVPTNQVRPAPPPPPPRKVDKVVEHHVISDAAVIGAMSAFGIAYPKAKRIDMLTALFYALSRDLDVSGHDIECTIRDHVSKMVGTVPRFSDPDRESWSRELATELVELMQRHEESKP